MNKQALELDLRVMVTARAAGMEGHLVWWFPFTFLSCGWSGKCWASAGWVGATSPIHDYVVQYVAEQWNIFKSAEYAHEGLRYWVIQHACGFKYIIKNKYIAAISKNSRHFVTSSLCLWWTSKHQLIGAWQMALNHSLLGDSVIQWRFGLDWEDLLQLLLVWHM